MTEVLSERIHHKKPKGVSVEVTGCYRSDNSGVSGEITEVLAEREQQKKEIKEIKWEIKEQIDKENRILHEENEKLLQIQRQQKQQKTENLPPSPIYSSEQLLGRSNEFIQKIGFGFTNNPRHVLDSIYKHLPEDYQVKEDPKGSIISWPEVLKFKAPEALKSLVINFNWLVEAVTGVASLNPSVVLVRLLERNILRSPVFKVIFPALDKSSRVPP